MVVIRQTQKQALNAAREGRVAQCIQRRIRRWHPERCEQMGEEAVRAAVLLAIRRGRECGLRTKGELFFFLDLMIRYGFEFDRDLRFPWCRAILKDHSVPPHERLERIRERMSVEQGDS